MTVSENLEEQTVEELLLPVLDHLSKGDFDIPLLPHVANQVLLLANDPEGNSTQLSAVIEQDQVLASRVLQLANCAAYGPRYPIETLPQAISWLGMSFLAGTAFSFSVQTGVFKVDGYEDEVQELWAHTMAVALYAKFIAGRLGKNQDNAFLFGLLHAIGKPYVIHTVTHYQQTSKVHHPWAVLDRVIQESYVEAGRQIAVAWELPEPVKEAICFHQDCAFEQAKSPDKGAAITCLARHMAGKTFGQESVDANKLRTLPIGRFLGITQEDVSALLDSQEHIRATVDLMLV